MILNVLNASLLLKAEIINVGTSMPGKGVLLQLDMCINQCEPNKPLMMLFHQSITCLYEY